MQRRDLNAPDAPLPVAAYTQAIEVSGATRTLYISGQVGQRMDGTIPYDIVEQSRLAWQNLEAQLKAAGMTLDNLVKITTILPNRGDLVAAREVRGLVTTTGVRDVAEITAARFPVWSQFISAQGTQKAFAGAVNVPVSIAGTVVRPGDVVVADGDGVVCVPRESAAQVAAAGKDRIEQEDEARVAFTRGELGLDRYQLRPVLERLGVSYVRADHEEG